jgi:hypothetical protein
MKLINNEWDRDNLEFLLNTKGDDFTAFWAQADEDDKLYARELMDAFSLELKIRSEELRVEAELALSNNQEASQVIQQFRLTK